MKRVDNPTRSTTTGMLKDKGGKRKGEPTDISRGCEGDEGRTAGVYIGGCKRGWGVPPPTESIPPQCSTIAVHVHTYHGLSILSLPPSQSHSPLLSPLLFLPSPLPLRIFYRTLCVRGTSRRNKPAQLRPADCDR